jgi:hypothetical protein
MPIGVWVTIFVFCGTAIVSLIIAFMNRKQMRQIELHRVDPTVPLIPPPGAATEFLVHKGPHIMNGVNGCMGLVFLLHEMRLTTPLTRVHVFAIALFTSLVAFAGLCEYIHCSANLLFRALEKLAAATLGNRPN